MFRGISTVCIFCESRSLLNVSRGPSTRSSSAQIPLQPSKSVCQIRSLARLAHKRRPAHLELSHKVAQRTPNRSDDGKLIRSKRRREVEGPFAGMNQTVARIRDDPRHDSRRTTTFRYQTGKDKDRGPRKYTGRSDYKALKERQMLIRVGYGARSGVKRSIEDIDSFEQFALLPSVQQSIATQVLRGQNDIKPTPVQRLAIPTLLGSRPTRTVPGHNSSDKTVQFEQFLIAAETGSGKTLAYLIPTISSMKLLQLKEEEEAKMEKKQEVDIKSRNLFELDSPPLSDEESQKAGRPRVIVLVPSAELVDQIGAVAKAMSHEIKFRASLISSAYTPKVIRNRLFSPNGIDVLITTPQLLGNIVTANPSVLSRVTHLVIDEADSLLDRSFIEYTTAIINRATPSLKQLIMCSATIPRRMDTYLRRHYPDAVRLTTPNLHAIPRRVQLAVVDVDQGQYHSNKDLACADTIWSIGGTAADSPGQVETGQGLTDHAIKRIIVFVNEREKAIELAEYLRSKGIDAVGLNRDTKARFEKSEDRLAEFTGAELSTVEQSTTQRNKKGFEIDISSGDLAISRTTAHGRKLRDTKVLVVTDLASRGIDTTAVRHVILYDVPHSSIDFIHRLGRTGRMGRRGKATVLVGKGDRRDVVSEVREGMFKGQALI